MTDMIERAARTIYEERAAVPPTDPAKWSDASEEAREWIRGHVRAALLAALDPEDGALVTHVAKALHCDGFTNEWADVSELSKQEFLDHARVAITALKSHCAQGENGTP